MSSKEDQDVLENEGPGADQIDAIRERLTDGYSYGDGEAAVRVERETVIGDVRSLLTAHDSLRVELEEEKRLRVELKQIALDGFSDLSGCSDVFIEEKRRLQQEITTARETIEAGSLLLETAREEIAELRILTERAYPGLKESGFCSRHGGPGFTDYPVDCRVCFPDLRALITQHIKVGVERVATARSTALSEAVEKVKGLSVMDVSAVPGRPLGPQEFKDSVIAALESLKESSHNDK